jgi:hypothetical protein
MKRDPMRVFAWLLVALGAANIMLTIPVVNALNKIADEVTSQIASTYGRYSEPNYGGYGPGFVTGAVIAGFGVLLLAIRRPHRRAELQATEPRPAEPYPPPPAWMSGSIARVRTKIIRIVSGPADNPASKVREMGRKTAREELEELRRKGHQRNR